MLLLEIMRCSFPPHPSPDEQNFRTLAIIDHVEEMERRKMKKWLERDITRAGLFWVVGVNSTRPELIEVMIGEFQWAHDWTNHRETRTQGDIAWRYIDCPDMAAQLTPGLWRFHCPATKGEQAPGMPEKS
jgi:hypothetical protein